MQNPMAANAVQSTGNDRVKPNTIQENVSGSVTNIIALRRPILSHNGPLSKLPIGWAIWENAAENRISECFLSNFFRAENRCLLIGSKVDWEWRTPYRVDSGQH